MIDMQELTKVYSMGETEVRALDGICLYIDKGKWVAITGPSGSGKSTLMNILGCLDQPSSGSCNLDGIEVAQMNDDALAAVRNRKIGFVFQGFNLLSRTTAIANVELPLIYAGVRDRKERTVRIKDGVIASDEPNGAPIPVPLPELQEAPLVRQAPRRQEMPRR
jgi:putative ABC transport system ATP-binding protein